MGKNLIRSSEFIGGLILLFLIALFIIYMLISRDVFFTIPILIGLIFGTIVYVFKLNTIKRRRIKDKEKK